MENDRSLTVHISYSYVFFASQLLNISIIIRIIMIIIIIIIIVVIIILWTSMAYALIMTRLFLSHDGFTDLLINKLKAHGFEV